MNQDIHIPALARVEGEGVVAERLRIELGDWTSVRAQAEPVRFAVFVEEQQVPAEIELDEFDPLSVHALAFDAQGRVLGTGRLIPDGHIGRMAVLRQARGAGVGSALLQALMQAARARGEREVGAERADTRDPVLRALRLRRRG